ncbi:MAG TPA: hypothetical protein VJI70_00860 [Candidatus Paceibacterota bacterium]
MTREGIFGKIFGESSRAAAGSEFVGGSIKNIGSLIEQTISGIKSSERDFKRPGVSIGIPASINIEESISRSLAYLDKRLTDSLKWLEASPEQDRYKKLCRIN